MCRKAARTTLRWSCSTDTRGRAVSESTLARLVWLTQQDVLGLADAYRKLLPFAKAYNARILLANRRDYPGTTPYSIEERAEVYAAAVEGKNDPEAAQKRLVPWMKERGREVYDLLVHIVAQHQIPPIGSGGNSGGIVVGGWSFGTTLMTALLANLDSFPVGDIDLRKYLRRVVFLGASAAYRLPLNGLALI